MACFVPFGAQDEVILMPRQKSNTPHAHYACTQYQNITLAGSYFRATDDPYVTNRTLLSIVKVLFFFFNYIDLQKRMGDASDYETFNGHVFKKGQGISASNAHDYSSIVWEPVSMW